MNRSLTAHHSFIRDAIPGWCLYHLVRARLAESEGERLLELRKVAVHNQMVAHAAAAQTDTEVAKIDCAIRENDSIAKRSRMRSR